MDLIEDFEAVFGTNHNVAYDSQALERIRRNRGLLEGELFVDRLLKALSVQEITKLYPPRTNEDLRILHQQIISSPSPDHYKHSVLYYLLKDVSPKKSQGTDDFAKVTYLPDKYKIFVDGIWFLDQLALEKALDYLTEPALVPTFPEEILYTLCRHAPENDVSLPVGYYHTVSPPLTSSKTLEAYFQVLCQVSITEAFAFSRAQGALNHRYLFEKLISFVLDQSPGSKKASTAVELIEMPLDDDEKSWFEEYLQSVEGSKLSGASETLIVRSIIINRKESKSDYGVLTNAAKLGGVGWDALAGNRTQRPSNSSSRGRRTAVS